MNFDVLLLPAGKGTRLSTSTDSVPKCLVNILGRPLLHYWLELLTKKIIRFF
jgi:mannose-1-phosphate guanylyltransferase